MVVIFLAQQVQCLQVQPQAALFPCKDFSCRQVQYAISGSRLFGWDNLMLVAHCAVGGGDKPRLTVLPGAEGVLQLHIRTPGWREGRVYPSCCRRVAPHRGIPLSPRLPDGEGSGNGCPPRPRSGSPGFACNNTSASPRCRPKWGSGRCSWGNSSRRSPAGYRALRCASRFLHRLVGFFGRQTGFSLFITEDVVIYPVGAQLFRDGHAEAFPDVRFPYPCSSGVVDAQRPGEAVERPPKPCRPLPIDGIASGNRRLVPVVITVDASYDPVDTDASVQN